jgi:DNA repair ATPase RecN
MATTLKLKNESQEVVTLIRPGGTDKLTIDPGTEADVEEPLLSADLLRPLVKAGRLSFVPIQDATSDQAQLARRVLSPLLNSFGAQIIGLGGEVATCIKTMKQLRDNYNASWDAHNKTLRDAKPEAEAADRFAKSVEALLATDPERKEVERLKAKVAALEKEDLKAAGARSADEYYKDRQATERELAAAEAALVKAEREVADRHGATIKSLKAAADGLKQLEPKKAIGDRLKTDW